MNVENAVLIVVDNVLGQFFHITGQSDKIDRIISQEIVKLRAISRFVPFATYKRNMKSGNAVRPSILDCSRFRIIGNDKRKLYRGEATLRNLLMDLAKIRALTGCKNRETLDRCSPYCEYLAANLRKQ